MEPIRFYGQNVMLSSPVNWDEARDGKCVGLPIQRLAAANDGSRPQMRSFWRPTAEELAALTAGACVCLSVLGEAHPPVWISVEAAQEIKSQSEGGR